MKKLHLWLKEKIIAFVDFFYPPFKKIIPLQTFRYAACGGGNMLLSNVLFFLFFHYVVSQQNFGIIFFRHEWFVLKPQNAALFLSYLICTPIGFYLNLFVVFPGSHLRRNIQFFRYIVVSIINLMLNYFLLKFFVEGLHLYPSIANLLNTIIIVALTYILQRNFSFREKNN
ncbi:MAG TPA: GtrA family protein [Arachidicoccus sp.]